MDDKLQPYYKAMLFDEMVSYFELRLSASNTELMRISADLLSAQGRLNGRGVFEYLLRKIFYELRRITDNNGVAKPISYIFKVAATFDYIRKQQANSKQPRLLHVFYILFVINTSYNDAH